MKDFFDNLYINSYISKTFDMYFGGKKCAVFDIETTGLSPKFSKIILSGLLLPGENGCQVTQFFAENPSEEKAVIESTLQVLQDVDYVVTYNGRSFDMPFLKERAQKYGLSMDAWPYDLDLYQVVRHYCPICQSLESLSQKSLERFMGISNDRDDLITGGDSVELYNRYLSMPSLELERQILLHNHDDVVQLFQLLPIIDKSDFHRAMSSMGFPAKGFTVSKVTASGGELRVSGQQSGSIKDYISFPTEEHPYTLTMSKSDASFKLTFPAESKAGAMYLDARAILGEASQKIEKYPSVVDGYLIIKDGKDVNHLAINAFLIEFFSLINQL